VAEQRSRQPRPPRNKTARGDFRATTTNSSSGEVRIQKFISDAGICSRREAEERIRQGRVLIDGKVAEIGQKVLPGENHIQVDGVGINKIPQKIYLILHKPTGVVSSRKDPFQRRTVLDVLGLPGQYVFPVGRLDADSEGLVLLTNDGGLANRLTHPRSKVSKVYRVLSDCTLAPPLLQKFERGMFLVDGKTAPAKIRELEITPKGTWYEVTLTEGRNRQIRRMLGQLGAKTKRLIRVRLGPISLGRLPKGQHRPLTEEEVRLLLDPDAKPTRAARRRPGARPPGHALPRPARRPSSSSRKAASPKGGSRSAGTSATSGESKSRADAKKATRSGARGADSEKETRSDARKSGRRNAPGSGKTRSDSKTVADSGRKSSGTDRTRPGKGHKKGRR